MLSKDELAEIREAVKETEHHDDEIMFFHTRKARNRCIVVMVIVLILAISFRIFHHELLARGIDFALGSLIDYFLFGTVEG